jgi:hypothetical protein
MEGGYTLTTSGINNGAQLFQQTSVTHFDAADVAKVIVAPRLGDSLLLPLAGDRFVLFSTACVPDRPTAADSCAGVRVGDPPRSTDTFRQFLDSAGNPVGEATRVASRPVAATELADKTFVVFTKATGGGFTAQRFNANGAALSDPAPVDASTAAALTNGNLALGWSATPPGGDLDVFTERVLVRN